MDYNLMNLLFYFVGQSLASLEFYYFLRGNLNGFASLRIPAFSCLPFYYGERTKSDKTKFTTLLEFFRDCCLRMHLMPLHALLW